MSSTDRVWWRPGGRSPFALDPTKPRWPQIGSAIGQSLIIFGGPAIGLVAITHYPFLIADRTIYIGGIAAIVFWFVASFAMFGSESFPRGMPPFLRLQFRAGFALCITFLLLGVFGTANGYRMPTISREVAVVAKANRNNYVAMRAWPPSRTVVELAAPREVYDRLAVPRTEIDTPLHELEAMPDRDTVRLIVGQGRLGVEWLKGVELP